MSNAVKCWSPVRVGPRDSTGLRRTRLRCQLLGCGAALIAVTLALPGPASWPAALTATASDGPADAIDAVGDAVLAVASMLVWGLLVWCALVAGAVLAARLPGGAGRAGRATLLRLAPLSAVRVLTAAVGLSLLAATSGCATPLVAAAKSASTAADLPSAGATADGTASAENPGATESLPEQSGPDVSGTVSVDIDWPGAAPSGDGRDGGTQPVSTSPTAGDSQGPEVAQTTGGPAVPSTASEPDPGSNQAPASTLPADGAAPGRPTTPSPAPPPSPPSASVSAAPTRATASSEAASNHAPPPAAPAGRDAVTVRAGDSLWAIAQRALPPPMTDAEIDSAWRAWYVANAAVIGNDPDLIQPGQVLLSPSSKVG